MTVQEFHKVAESIIDKTLVRQESCCSTCTLATCCHETVYVGKDEVEWMLASMTPEQLDYLLYATMLGIEMANGKTHAEAKELMARLTKVMLEVPEPEIGGDDVIVIKV